MACSKLGRGLSMWRSAERHRVRALAIVTFLAFVVVNGSRRTAAEAEIEGRAAALIAFLAASCGVVGAFALARRWDASKLEPSSRTPLLLALAFTPVPLAVGTTFAGASRWVLWAALLLVVALGTWWASETTGSRNGRG